MQNSNKTTVQESAAATGPVTSASAVGLSNSAIPIADMKAWAAREKKPTQAFNGHLALALA